MYKATFIFLALTLLPSVPILAQSPGADTAQSPDTSAAPAKQKPQPGGKGPGMGRAYQKSTPGPGLGGPDYRGGHTGDPSFAADGPSHPAPPPPQGAPYRYEQQPNQRPGMGRGGRGYGYGYPGYRGQGGSGYPQHRQYGNPPRYPADLPRRSTPQQ